MQSVTRYQANDGSLWVEAHRAVERDALIQACNKIIALLKPTPTELNWEGYIQQEASVVGEIKQELFQLANRDGVLKWWIDRQKSEHGKTEYQLIHEVHPSWFCRMLDGGSRPLDEAYNRLCCIDSYFREWNQPYFAIHPDEGKQVCRG